MSAILDFSMRNTGVKLPIAYGKHIARMNRLKHVTTFIGNDPVITIQQGAAEGPWDGLETLWVDGYELAATDVNFHPGLENDVPDANFPDDDPHPWAAYYSAKLPRGFDDTNSEAVTGVFRTLRTANFNGGGEQINPIGDGVINGPEIWPGTADVPNPALLNPNEFYYYPNPAIISVDQILRWARRERLTVNWEPWADWRDFNDELIWWDDAKYTPRAVSLTPGGGGELPAGTYYVRVAARKGGDYSSASSKDKGSPEQVITVGADSVIQVSWLMKGDELEIPAPPADHDGYRIYIKKEVDGAWGNIEVVDGAEARTAVIEFLPPAGAPPLDLATIGLQRQIKRFESHIFMVPPYGLYQALDYIMKISCADWQWANGKLNFFGPAPRVPVFTLDLTQTGFGSFKTWSVDRRNSFNQVVVEYRDLESPYLEPAEPVILTRDEIVAKDGMEKPYTINLGVNNRSTAERVAAFWARTLIDADQAAELLGSPKTYHVLPGDVVNVTNDIPDWTDVQFKVEHKEENVHKSLGDPLQMRYYFPDAYSDVPDSRPLAKRLPERRLNPFTAPPHVLAVTGEETGGFAPDGSYRSNISVHFTFPEFVIRQVARIQYRLQGTEAWITSGTMTKDPNTPADPISYEIGGVPKGNWEVRVVNTTNFNSAIIGTAPTIVVPVNSVPPRPAPINGAGARDSNYQWRITWDRGIRVSNVLDTVDPYPRYRIRLRELSFLGDVKRQFDVNTSDIIIPMQWTFHNIGFPCGGAAVADEDGSIYHPGSMTDTGCVYWSQLINGEADILWESSDKLTPRGISLINGDNTATQVFWDTTYTAGIPKVVPQFQLGRALRLLPKMRFGIKVRRNQAIYTVNDAIIWQSDKLPIQDSYLVQIVFGLLDGEEQELKKAQVLPTEREVFFYTAGMQTNDFDEVQDELFVEIRELSNNPSAPEGDPLFLHLII